MFFTNLLNQKEITEIFRRFNLHNPNPQIELNYVNNYTLAVAVILSAQSTDKMVNKITPKLFAKAENPKDMLNLGEEKLKISIKNIGLYNNKARSIIQMSSALIEKFDGQLPNTFEDLIKLPGIGMKSANVLLNTLFAHPTIAVDTHVFRLSNRIGFCNATSPEKVSLLLPKIIPAMWQRKSSSLACSARKICVSSKET